MTNRRQFIHSSFALTVAGSSVFSIVGAQSATPPMRFTHFVFDKHFPAATAVARDVARTGTGLAETDGDMTALWYDELDLAWRKSPMPLAGVTTHQALFVLETLAADHRMRVIYRGAHAVSDDGAVSHRFSGPAHLIERIRAESATTPWVSLVASAMNHCPVGDSQANTLTMMTPTEAASSFRTEPLVSWIIAPRSVAALIS